MICGICFFSQTCWAILSGAFADVFANEAEEGLLKHRAFTEYATDLLDESGLVSSPMPAFFKEGGIHVDGYAFDEEDSVIDLFITVFEDGAEVSTLPKKTAESKIKNALKFVERVKAGRSGGDQVGRISVDGTKPGIIE